MNDSNSIIIVFVVGFVFFAAIFNSLMDLSSENLFKKDWWNKDSWKNKWKLDSNGNPMPAMTYWWYFGLYKPEFQERFPYSSTALVFLTDGWHLFQFLFHTSWQSAVATGTYLFEKNVWSCVVVFISVKLIFSISFELIYSNLKKRMEQ